MKHGLIITHAGSGGTLLCRILSSDYAIRSYGRTGVLYNHPSAIFRAREKIDRMISGIGRGGWYVDKLLFNHEFTCKTLYKECKFIYLVRKPLVPLATLIQRGYPALGAENYYLFRLRRMCEMARKTPASVLLTYEDLVSSRALPLLKSAFRLNSLTEEFKPFHFDDNNLQAGKVLKNPVEPVAAVPEDVLRRCSYGYERYFNFLAGRLLRI